MKILVISNLYPPDFLGGYELGCRQMVRALTDHGHDVRVLTANPRTPVPPQPGVYRRLRLVDVYDSDTHNVSPLPSLGEKRLEAHGVQAVNVHAVTEALTEFDPDVVYLWNLVGIGGIGVIAAVQHLGYPWVMHIMDAVPKVLCTLPFHVRREVGEAFARLLHGRYLCCSQTVLDEIEAGGVPIGGRSAIVPNWVVAGPDPVPRTYTDNGRLRIVSAGYMSVAKGMDIVVKAAGLLRDRGHDNFTVDMYGPGDGTPFRALVHELDLADRVRVCGARSQSDLLALLPNYDVFLFPTHAREPFGFAPMEATARGCVSVVSRVCGYSEWMVDGSDCLKAERTPVGFADALERLVTGATDLAALGRRGMRTVLQYFRLDGIYPTIEAELARAASAPRVPSGSPADVYRMAVLAEKMVYALLHESFAA